MKLAERMSRIGVESAFEVLVRARALEAPGRRTSSTWKSASRISPRRRTSSKRPRRRSMKAGRTTVRRRASRAARGGRRAMSRARAISASARSMSRIVPGGKPIIFFPMLALLEPGDEVIYPNPGFPIYESMIRFLGATPVPIPLIEERGFSFDLDLLRDTPLARNQNAGAQFAAESDRRRDSRRRHPRHRRSGARPRPDGALRRDLFAHLLRRGAASRSRAFRACWRRPSSWTAFRRPTP